MEDIIYTVQEVAEMLKVNQGYVHKLRKSGLLKFLKLGCYKVRKAELERFLEANEGYDLTDPYSIKKIEIDSEDTPIVIKADGSALVEKFATHQLLR